MKQKGIQLVTNVSAATLYLGFNMLDPILSRKLRQAISIAIDAKEYISIFLNDRGAVAQSPLPPGIFGYRDWKDQSKSIEVARRLVADAGYPNGVDAKTGKPLVLYLDWVRRGINDQTRLNWYRKQFKKLGIQLIARVTDYNRFQDKMRTGNAQIFLWVLVIDFYRYYNYSSRYILSKTFEHDYKNRPN